MEIHIKLDKILHTKDISQHELSRLTGIRQATISDMCQNKAKMLPLENLAKICDALDCDISDILELKKERPE